MLHLAKTYTPSRNLQQPRKRRCKPVKRRAGTAGGGARRYDRDRDAPPQRSTGGSALASRGARVLGPTVRGPWALILVLACRLRPPKKHQISDLAAATIRRYRRNGESDLPARGRRLGPASSSWATDSKPTGHVPRTRCSARARCRARSAKREPPARHRSRRPVSGVRFGVRELAVQAGQLGPGE